MEKQTFQQGDRVVIGQASEGIYNISRCGERGTLKSILPRGYLVVLDNADLNRPEGVWYVSQDDLTHETHVDIMKIKHREYGTVEGVKPRPYTVGWEKFENGRLSFFDPEQGWSQVPETEWVTIQVENQGWSKMKLYCLVYGPRGVGGNECTKWRYPQ